MNNNSKMLLIIPTHIDNYNKLSNTIKLYSTVTNNITLFIPEKEKTLFIYRLIHSKFSVAINLVTHNIKKGYIGMIKYQAMYYGKSIISNNDVCILIDDDLQHSRYVTINKIDNYLKDQKRKNTISIQRYNKPYKNLPQPIRISLSKEFNFETYTRQFQKNELRDRIYKLALTAQINHYPFFTVSCSSKPGIFRYSKTNFYTPTAFFSGWLGFFKNSPNYFHPYFKIGSDWYFTACILSTYERFNILADMAIVQSFTIGSYNYGLNGNRYTERNNALFILERIQFKGFPMFTITESSNMNISLTKSSEFNYHIRIPKIHYHVRKLLRKENALVPIPNN
jgi:hypothetical protein